MRGATAVLAALPIGPHNITIHGINLVSEVLVDFNFSIESRVEGASSAAYQYYGENKPVIEILQGESVIFNVSIDSGTSITILWDFDDGSPIEVYDTGQSNAWPVVPGYEYRAHSFTTPGVFHVEVTVKNNFDTYTFSHKVIVYNEVENLTLTSNSPRPFVNQRGVVDLFFTTTGNEPTLAEVVFDYGDGSPVSSPVTFGIYPMTYQWTYGAVRT